MKTCNVKPNLPTAGLVFYTGRAMFFTESAKTSIEKKAIQYRMDSVKRASFGGVPVLLCSACSWLFHGRLDRV